MKKTLLFIISLTVMLFSGCQNEVPSPSLPQTNKNETSENQNNKNESDNKNENITPPDNQYFEPTQKQPIGFDSNPLFSKDYLHRIIRNYVYNGGALRDNPKPYVDFDTTENKIILSPREKNTVTLSLVDTQNNNVIPDDNVEWFIVQSYPWDSIFDADESHNDYCPVKIEHTNQKATVNLTANITSNYNTKNETFGDIIAVVDGKYIHRKAIYVLNNSQDNDLETHNEVEKVINEMISPMWHLSDLEKALFMQEAVDMNLTYDMDFLRKPTYENLFIKKRAVCEGYARMYARLGKELGMVVREDIDTTTANHAWNRIWIDDGFYYIDTTWDDQDEDNDYLLYYFLMPVENFEYDHPRTKSARKDGNFGTKHLSIGENEQKYKDMKAKGIPVADPGSISASPDLSKIDFIGDGINTGYIITSETDLEYTTGNDGKWTPLIPGVKNKVNNITMENESVYDPKENLPYYIMVRKVESGKKPSEYKKINIYKKYNNPTWIEVTPDGTVHNISTKMEYSTNGQTDFIQVTDNTMKLEPGTYYFRLKGTKNNLASEAVEINFFGTQSN